MRRDRRSRPSLTPLEDRLPLSGDGNTDPFDDPFVPPADMGGSAPGYVADDPFAQPVDSDQHSVGYYPLYATDPFDDPFAPPAGHSLAPADDPTPD